MSYCGSIELVASGGKLDGVEHTFDGDLGEDDNWRALG